MMLSLLLALQAAGPTVGDTVWVGRTVRPPAGYQVRAAEWQPEGAVALVGRPMVVVRGDSVEVRYPLVAWQTGAHVLTVPGPVLLGPAGEQDSLAPRRVTLTIASVLPAVPEDSTLPPQPPATIVPQSATTPLPLVAGWGVALALLAPLWWWWPRRGPTAAAAAPPARPAPPLERWAAAGECRAVVETATAELRGMVARLEPAAHRALDNEEVLAAVRGRQDWPLADLAALLRRLDTARFAPASAQDALELARAAQAMARRLGGEGEGVS